LSDETVQQISRPFVWVGIDDLEVKVATHFVGQVAGLDEISLIIGQVLPPILMGTREEIASQAEEIQFVIARPLARINMTPHRAKELIEILNQAVIMNENIRKAESTK
jgi:hypothetical protein